MVESAISCGVVTIIAPSGLAFIRAFTTVKCSSDVPGGVCAINESRKKCGDVEIDHYRANTYLHKIPRKQDIKYQIV